MARATLTDRATFGAPFALRRAPPRVQENRQHDSKAFRSMRSHEITLEMFLHFVRIAGHVLSAMPCAAAKLTLLGACPVAASMSDARACNSTVSLQWFQAVTAFRHFYCQGLGQWTVPDNNVEVF